MRRILFTLALTGAVAAPAGAQQLKIAFNQGLVSIDATSVPVRAVLSEWSKLGGTKVVGGERVAGAPLTLKLENVPEAQALEVVLRNVAGYMAAPRTATTGASIYDRILVLATSSAPPPAAGPPAALDGAARRPTAGTQRAIPPRFQPPQPAEDEEPLEEEEDTEPTNQPVFTFPQPGQPGQQFGGNGGPIISVNPATGAPQNITLNPAPAPNSQGSTSGTSATPGFSGVGAAVPGVIQQPPPTSTPTSTQRPQPGPMTRPPGGGV